MCTTCEELNIPERLWKLDKPIIHDFKDDVIYRRFKVVGPKENWKTLNLTASVFQLNTDSYNKASLCESADDVLFNSVKADCGKHYTNWGILSISSNDLTDINSKKIKLNNEERVFTLKFQHVPEDCMYPHSEILIMEDDTKLLPKAPKSIGVIIRDFFVEKCNIIKYPIAG